MTPSAKFPSVQWLHDTVVAVATVAVVAFVTTWLATPVFTSEAIKSAWSAGVAAGSAAVAGVLRTVLALLSGFLNGTASLKPHQVELGAPPPVK